MMRRVVWGAVCDQLRPAATNRDWLYSSVFVRVRLRLSAIVRGASGLGEGRDYD